MVRETRLCSPRVPHSTNNLSATARGERRSYSRVNEFQHVMGSPYKRQAKAADDLFGAG
jgi:hypothetical protein